MTSVVEIVSQQTVVVDGTPQTSLVVSSTGQQGPPGPQGPPGAQGPQGIPGPPGGAYEDEIVFASPVQVWEASHPLTIIPNVITLDTSGARIEGDITYPTPNSVRVEWAFPMAGTLIITS